MPTSSKDTSRETAYDKHKWILRLDSGLYCSCCMEFGVINQSNKGVWINKPFTALKKLSIATKKHASSILHKNAMFASQLAADSRLHGTVVGQTAAHAAVKSIGDKEVLKKLVHAAYFLLKEEISHTTNWQCLLTLLGECDFSGRIQKFLDCRPRNATYQSSTSITEFLDSISAVLDDQLCNRIKQSIAKFGVWSLMADEATNINNAQVVSVCVRYLSTRDNYSITEQLVSVSVIPAATAEIITTRIVD